jgi:LytS/YehU family sensor histidine kinase
MERARLRALQAQMNPHFLFNTLNTVAALAGPESPQTERVVERLAVVLRHSLQRADLPFTSMDDEVRFAREYLAVEEDRLGFRLRLSWDVQPDTLPLRIPTTSLLRLVEHAIARAVDARPNGGHLWISSSVADDRLQVSVEDGGPGEPAPVKDDTIFDDLRRRFWNAYGERYALDIEAVPDGRRVTVQLPAEPFDAQAGAIPERRLA